MSDLSHQQELNQLASLGYFLDAEEQPQELTIYEKLQLRIQKKEQKKEKKTKLILLLLDFLPEDLVKIIYTQYKFILETEKNKLKYTNVIQRIKFKLEPDFFENAYFEGWYNTPERIAQEFEENVDEEELKYYHLPIKTKEDCYQIIVDSEKLTHSRIGGWCWTYTDKILETIQ
jgi:hypothetical protein